MFGRVLRFLFFKNQAITYVATWITLAIIGLVALIIGNSIFDHSNNLSYIAYILPSVILLGSTALEGMKKYSKRADTLTGIMMFGFIFLVILTGYISAEDGASRAEAIGYSASILFLFFSVMIIAALPQEIAKITEKPSFRQWFSFGQGGNARWAGAYTFDKLTALPKTERGLFLGKTLMQDTVSRTPISLPRSDDAHHITIAQTGAGKSVTALWTNLKRYPGPMIVLDPKGEHATFSAASRLNGSYILDPFGRVTDPALGSMRVSYNPLDNIDINAPGARGFLEAISDGCVLKEEKDKHFSENAKTIIEGVIAHVLSRHPKEDQNLPFVANLFRGFDPELGVSDPAGFDAIISEMSTNNAAGGLPMDAANILLSAGDRERGSTLTTCFRSLKWVTDPPMRTQLMGSDFPILRDTIRSNGGKSIFIVLPFEYMEESSQIRWMRTLINVATVYLFRHPIEGNDAPKLLLILDEFFKLGYMAKLEEGIVTARGAGMKYWVLTQDIGQLKKLYSATWETFLGSSNVQVFGMNHQDTLEWVASALGGEKDKSSGRYPLLRPDQVREFLGKESPTQIIIPVNGLPMRLERVAFEPLKTYRGMEL